MSNQESVEDAKKRYDYLVDIARSHYEMSVICLDTDNYTSAGYFQEQSRLYYELAAFITTGLIQRQTEAG